MLNLSRTLCLNLGLANQKDLEHFVETLYQTKFDGMKKSKLNFKINLKKISSLIRLQIKKSSDYEMSKIILI